VKHGQLRQAVGSCGLVECCLAPRATTLVVLAVNLLLDGPAALAVVPLFEGATLQLALAIDATAVVDVRIGVGAVARSVVIGFPFDKKCSFRLSAGTASQPQFLPMACGDSFDALAMPHTQGKVAKSGPGPGSAHPGAPFTFAVPQRLIDKATWEKNFWCGSCALIGYVGVAVVLVRAFGSLCTSLEQRPDRRCITPRCGWPLSDGLYVFGEEDVVPVAKSDSRSIDFVPAAKVASRTSSPRQSIEFATPGTFNNDGRSIEFAPMINDSSSQILFVQSG